MLHRQNVDRDSIGERLKRVAEDLPGSHRFLGCGYAIDADCRGVKDLLRADGRGSNA